MKLKMPNFLVLCLAVVWIAGCDLKGADLSPNSTTTVADTPTPVAAVSPFGAIAPIYGTAVVSTYAGAFGVAATVDGVGSAARFYGPGGLGTDGAFIHVAETLSHVVRRIDLATGMVITVAGTPNMAGNSPCSVGPPPDNGGVRDPIDIEFVGGRWYFSENHNRQISYLDAAPCLGPVRVAGNINSVQFYLDGLADPMAVPPINNARFYNPRGLAAVGSVLYIADTSNLVIRSYDTATLMVSTVAGVAGTLGYRDGPALQALFDSVSALATDGSNLYIGDTGSGYIRKLDLTTMEVTTLSGNGQNGFVDGLAADAEYTVIYDMAYDSGFLYACDWGNNAIRKIDVITGDVTSVAGRPDQKGYQDGTSTQARFQSVGGIAIAGGNMYISDTNNRVIRLITGY